jgi:hypothetical protein
LDPRLAGSAVPTISTADVLKIIYGTDDETKAKSRLRFEIRVTR